jgi:hypothetical protein
MAGTMLGEGLQEMKTVREGYQRGEDRAHDLLKKELISEKALRDSLMANKLMQSELESREAVNYAKIPEVSMGAQDYVSQLTDNQLIDVINKFDKNQLDFYERLQPNEKVDYLNKVIGAGPNFKPEADKINKYDIILNSPGLKEVEVPKGLEELEEPETTFPERKGGTVDVTDRDISSVDEQVDEAGYDPEGTMDTEGYGIDPDAVVSGDVVSRDLEQESIADMFNNALLAPVNYLAKGAIGAGAYLGGKAKEGAEYIADITRDPEPKKMGFSDLAQGRGYEEYKRAHPGRISEAQLGIFKAGIMADKRYQEQMAKIKANDMLKREERDHNARQKQADRINKLKAARIKGRAKSSGSGDKSVEQDQRMLKEAMAQTQQGKTVGEDAKVRAANKYDKLFQNKDWQQRWRDAVESAWPEYKDRYIWNKKRAPKAAPKKPAPKAAPKAAPKKAASAGRRPTPSQIKAREAVGLYYNPKTNTFGNRRPQSFGREVE